MVPMPSGPFLKPVLALGAVVFSRLRKDAHLLSRVFPAAVVEGRKGLPSRALTGNYTRSATAGPENSAPEAVARSGSESQPLLGTAKTLSGSNDADTKSCTLKTIAGSCSILSKRAP
jgi:hypothetical protein